MDYLKTVVISVFNFVRKIVRVRLKFTAEKISLIVSVCLKKIKKKKTSEDEPPPVW